MACEKSTNINFTIIVDDWVTDAVSLHYRHITMTVMMYQTFVLPPLSLIHLASSNGESGWQQVTLQTFNFVSSKSILAILNHIT